MRVTALALRVPLRDGERVRRMLLDEWAMRLDLKVRRDGDALLMPLVDGKARHGCEVVEAEFETTDDAPRHFSERLTHLPEEARAQLPSSFDAIGDVLLVKIPETLREYEVDIANALLETVPRIKTVAQDEGVEGDLRIRSLRVLAGRPETETEHVEYGVRLRVDPGTCYFSPRLATERHRVARLVQPGEHVVDLMAGVAPFALAIAKHSEAARIDAIDLNAAAIEFARENVRLNRAADRVFPEHADARAWAAAHPGIADRVITNLPHMAHAFLAPALQVLRPGGGVWHYHCIQDDDALDAHLAGLREEAAAMGRDLKVMATREVRTYAPGTRHFAVDWRVG